MRAAEIASLLARRADAVARRLLPQGRRVGKEWQAGSINGESGSSLQVRLDGEKAGTWADFATGESGDLLDLWALTSRISIATAMIEAMGFLGVSNSPVDGVGPGREYRRPTAPASAAPAGRVLKYLSEERGLSVPAINAYRVRSTPGDDGIIFPYFRDDELVLAKRLKLERTDGKKDIRPTEPGCEPALFGWQAIPNNARSVLLVEGEIDALSAWEMGYPALSVPFGGGKGAKQQWIEREFNRLEQFDEIFVAMDRDSEGKLAAAEIAGRLGIHRCRIVEIPAPHKDLNDLLRARVDLKPLIDRAAYMDPSELKSASSFVEEVIREFYSPDEAEPGFVPPWPKLHGRLHFRWSELTIVNGVNGHGKSQVVGQIALTAASRGERVCIASLELKPRKLLMRLTRQATGMDAPVEPYIRDVHDWYRDKFWIFDLVGTAKAERLLEVFRYARQRYGVRVFIIDSLLKCGIDESDYDGQKRFVERLCDFKNEHDVHVFLVTHSRKGESEEAPTGKLDVRGGGAITDLADTGLTIWRNKFKESRIAKAEAIGNPVDDELRGSPDAVLYCWKQRNGDWEKQIALWWHRDSFQFVESARAIPRVFVEFTSRSTARATA